MSKSSLELACEVWWGSFDPIDTTNPDQRSNDSPNFGNFTFNQLKDPTDPEKQFAFKESLLMLSEDAKLFATVLIDLPDDMVTSLGKPIKHLIVPYMKKKYGWKSTKTMIIQLEIANLLRTK